MRAATAAAEPDDEPPGVCSAFHGLRVGAGSRAATAVSADGSGLAGMERLRAERRDEVGDDLVDRAAAGVDGEVGAPVERLARAHECDDVVVRAPVEHWPRALAARALEQLPWL